MPAFDQEGDDPRQFAKDVIPVDRALEVLLATAAAGADSTANHPPDHLQMPIAEIAQLFVDLDE